MAPPVKADVNRDLIEGVRQHPLLYDQTNPDFKDALKKENAWQTIGTAFGKDGTWASRRFRTIRDNYTRRKRKLLMQSEEEGPPDSLALEAEISGSKKWPYFDMLSFLDPFSKYQVSEGGLGAAEGDEEDREDPPDQEAAAAGLEQGQGAEDSWLASPLVSTSIRRSGRGSDGSAPAADNSNAQEECLFWAQSLVMRLMALEPKQRSLIRLRVEQILFDVEFEGDHSVGGFDES